MDSDVSLSSGLWELRMSQEARIHYLLNLKLKQKNVYLAAHWIQSKQLRQDTIRPEKVQTGNIHTVGGGEGEMVSEMVMQDLMTDLENVLNYKCRSLSNCRTK